MTEICTVLTWKCCMHSWHQGTHLGGNEESRCCFPCILHSVQMAKDQRKAWLSRHSGLKQGGAESVNWERNNFVLTTWTLSHSHSWMWSCRPRSILTHAKIMNRKRGQAISMMIRTWKKYRFFFVRIRKWGRDIGDLQADGSEAWNSSIGAGEAAVGKPSFSQVTVACMGLQECTQVLRINASESRTAELLHIRERMRFN